MSWLSCYEQVDSTHLPSLSPASTAQGLPWGGDYLEYYQLDFEKDFNGLRHYLGSFDSAGEVIACHVFKMPEAQKTAFVYHGYYDHSGLFGNVIEYCLGHGMSVVIYDLPGHGLSTGARASIDDFLRYRQVLRDAFAAVAAFDLPQSRVALAQSTGCAVLNSHLLDGGAADFDKIIEMAPLVRPTAWWWGRPAHGLLQYFVNGLPRRFAVNSGDTAFLEFLRERDPLQHHHLPLSWVGALKRWLPWFIQLPSRDVPVLILQGDADSTVDWRYNLPMLRKKFPAGRVVMIPGARHHLAKEGLEIRAQLWQICDDYLFGSSEA